MPRISRNPRAEYSREVLIDGTSYPSAVGSEQSTSQEVPDKPLHDGAEVGQRNVANPEEGELQIAASSSEVATLRRLGHERDPITITTAESSVSDVVVEDVTRSVDPAYDDKYDTTVTWKQVQIANVGEGSIVAVTGDGEASGSAESETGSEVVGSDERETSDGPETESEPGFLEDALSPATAIGDDIRGFF